MPLSAGCAGYKTRLAPLIMISLLATSVVSSTVVLARTNDTIDSRDLESFFDGLITAQLRAYKVPGAVVSIVKDGRIFFSKGYGYANFEEGRRVEANETLFRIASVTKLFTWTAVMQLAEQGKLDLNTDVNTYLKTFQIPATYQEPITLIHLMTHSAGFDQTMGMSTHNVDDLRPLGEVLRDNLPERVRPPGEFSSYSNYGTALAGYIVEEVSGMSFDEYVEKNILDPLGMDHTTTRQPPPPELVPELAVGYTYSKGAYHPCEFLYHQLSPAISMSSTATDMAKFMIAHLQDGTYEDVQILGRDTSRLMKRQLFTHDPRVSGWAYGFMELDANGQHMVWHRGSWSPQFYTLLALMPENGIGLFVSYNGPGGGPARSALLRAFLDRYFPGSAEEVPQAPPGLKLQIRSYEGSYRKTSSVYRTFAKLTNLFNQVDLTVEKDSTLLMTGFGDPQHWIIVEPLVFRAVGRQPFFSRNLVFRKDGQGRITHFFLSNDPRFAFERIPWYERAGFNFLLLGLCAVLFASVIILPIRFLIHRHEDHARKNHIPPCRLAHWLTGSIGVLNLFFLGSLIAVGIQTGPAHEVPSFTISLLAIATIAAFMALGSVAFVVLAWKNHYWNLVGRIHYSLVTLAALTLVWWLNNWNLLGFQF